MGTNLEPHRVALHDGRWADGHAWHQPGAAGQTARARSLAARALRARWRVAHLVRQSPSPRPRGPPCRRRCAFDPPGRGREGFFLHIACEALLIPATLTAKYYTLMLPRRQSVANSTRFVNNYECRSSQNDLDVCKCSKNCSNLKP